MATAPARTVWVFGDQLNRAVGPIGRARPGVDRVLIVESAEHLARRPWHRQRAHLIVAAMRRFARELEAEGFEVDLRRADTYATGLAAHREAYAPATVVAMAPSSIRGRRLVAALGVDLEPDERFLTDVADFDELFAGSKDRKSTRLNSSH